MRRQKYFEPTFARDAETGLEFLIIESSPVFSFEWAMRFSGLVHDLIPKETLEKGGIHSMWYFLADMPLHILTKTTNMASCLEMYWELLEVCVQNPNGGKFNKKTASQLIEEPVTIEQLIREVLQLHWDFSEPA